MVTPIVNFSLASESMLFLALILRLYLFLGKQTDNIIKNTSGD